jgi:Uma2 family endonuclease
MASLTIPETLRLTHEQFQELARANRDCRLERSATGELVIMPPTGSMTGNRNLDIEGQLWLWNRQTRLGQAFNSSTGFHLPNGADLSPDGAWVSQAKWDALTLKEQEGFAPLAPDFVVELCSPWDNLKALRQKMKEYIENGTQLGFLIDRKRKKVEIYRLDGSIETLSYPSQVSGDPVLPGFILDLTNVW